MEHQTHTHTHTITNQFYDPIPMGSKTGGTEGTMSHTLAHETHCIE